MTKKRVAVFGARSKSAESLISRLRCENFEVSSYSSDPSVFIERFYDIHKGVENMPILDVDIVVYFSWTQQRDERNQKAAAIAATRFAEHARSQGVDVIFISTLAALPQSHRSHYGNYKAQAEVSMRQFEHAIVRPATIVSEGDLNFSSSMTSFLKLRRIVRFFLFFSERLFVPTVDIETFNSKVVSLIKDPLAIEVDLIDNIPTMENFSKVTSIKFRFPFSWIIISRFSHRSEFLDRLLTLVTVSRWIKENQNLLESNFRE
jgi:hypothetical protein